MKSMIVAGSFVIAALVVAYPYGSANAGGSGGGVNGSFARAYCEYYRTKAMVAARSGHSAGAAHGADDRGSAEYWRAVYRQCLKEHGY